jgi:HK97 family phage portal protein
VGIFQRITGAINDFRYANSPEFKEMRTYIQTITTGQGFLPAFVNTSGENISPQTAMRIATWFTCLQVRWDAVGMLPFQVFQKDGRKKTTATDHPAYYLLSVRPNAAMTATQFWKQVQQNRDNYGNCYCPIIRDPKGRIVEIDIIPLPTEVKVYSSNGELGKNELYYRYRGQDISSSDMLHFKGYSVNGRLGLSLTDYHSETVGRLRAIHKYGNRTVSANPGIYATSANAAPMDPKQKESFKDYWSKEMSGFGDRGTMPVLYNGFELKTVGMNPKDALYLEQIQATKDDIYGITKVPPQLAKNYHAGQTYNNGEQQNLDFLTWTLAPLLKDLEEECDYKLFTEQEVKKGFYTKFNEKALMRTDAKTQADFLTKIFSIGGYSINDVLEYLDENPVDNEFADDRFVPANNLVPLSMLREFIESKTHGPVPEATENEPGGKEVKPGEADNEMDDAIRKLTKMNGHKVN